MGDLIEQDLALNSLRVQDIYNIADILQVKLKRGKKKDLIQQIKDLGLNAEFLSEFSKQKIIYNVIVNEEIDNYNEYVSIIEGTLNKEIELCVVFDINGRLLIGYWNRLLSIEEEDLDYMSSKIALLIIESFDLLDKLKAKSFQQLFIKTDEGYLLVIAFPTDDRIMAVKTVLDIRLGLVFLDIKRIVEKISEIPYAIEEDFDLKKRIKQFDKEIEEIKTITKLISEDESPVCEFKSSLRYNYKTKQPDKILEWVIAKSISGFLNSEGGKLIIGVNDEGKIIGLKNDYKTLGRKKDRDGFSLKLSQKVNEFLGAEFSDLWTEKFYDLGNKEICVIDIKRSPKPAIIKNIKSKAEDFYVRSGTETRPHSRREMLEYSKLHFDQK